MAGRIGRGTKLACVSAAVMLAACSGAERDDNAAVAENLAENLAAEPAANAVQTGPVLPIGNAADEAPPAPEPAAAAPPPPARSTPTTPARRTPPPPPPPPPAADPHAGHDMNDM